MGRRRRFALRQVVDVVGSRILVEVSVHHLAWISWRACTVFCFAQCRSLLRAAGKAPCRDAHSAVVVALLAQLGWRPLSVKPEALVQSSPATCLRGEAKRSCLGVLPAGPRKRGSTLGLVAVASAFGFGIFASAIPSLSTVASIEWDSKAASANRPHPLRMCVVRWMVSE